MKANWATALCICLVACTAACSTKSDQCNRLIEVMNRAQPAKKSPKKGDANADPSWYEDLAATLKKMTKDVKAVELKDKRLMELRDSYAKMASELAKTTEQTAATLRRKDAEAIEKMRTKIKSFQPRERKLVADLNGYCQAK